MARMEEVESARREQEKLSGGGESKEKLSKKEGWCKRGSVVSCPLHERQHVVGTCLMVMYVLTK